MAVRRTIIIIHLLPIPEGSYFYLLLSSCSSGFSWPVSRALRRQNTNDPLFLVLARIAQLFLTPPSSLTLDITNARFLPISGVSESYASPRLRAASRPARPSTLCQSIALAPSPIGATLCRPSTVHFSSDGSQSRFDSSNNYLEASTRQSPCE